MCNRFYAVRGWLLATMMLFSQAVFAYEMGVFGTTPVILSGSLTNGAETDINVDGVPFRFDFYLDERTEEVLASSEVIANVRGGLFSAVIEYPSLLQRHDLVYYAVSADLDKDGHDASDLFSGRFPLARPANSLKSATVYRAFEARGNPPPQNWLDNGVVSIAPFVTPPVGVEFTEVTFELRCRIPNAATNPAKFAYAIYDSSGKKVHELRVEDLGFVLDPTPLTFGFEGYLEPNTLYYAAWVQDSERVLGDDGIRGFGTQSQGIFQYLPREAVLTVTGIDLPEEIPNIIRYSGSAPNPLFVKR